MGAEIHNFDAGELKFWSDKNWHNNVYLENSASCSCNFG